MAEYIATAVLPEAEPTIRVQTDSEDTDLVVIDGIARPTLIDYPASEDWEPEVYRKALAAAGWEQISDWSRDFCDYTGQVRWVGVRDA